MFSLSNLVGNLKQIEEGFKETALKLGRETKLYFDLNYFEDVLLAGKWDEGQNYISGFTSIGDNRYSAKIYFEIRKQKFLEELDMDNRAKALDILIKDLKVFSSWNEELFSEMTRLLTIKNIREHPLLANYKDANFARSIVVEEIKKVIVANPVFHGTLKCPSMALSVETTVEDRSVISLKRRLCQTSNEVASTITNVLPGNVVQILKVDSSPVTIDFHPIWHTLLLVGTDIGNIGLWDVDSGERIFCKNYRIWGVGASSINSRIDAHDGSVNDLAFSSLDDNKLLVITCGDDKTIKVWNASNGANRYIFEGHDAPVCSICPHVKQHVHLIVSTSIDGKIKAWLYDSLGARVDFNAPGHGYTTLAYSVDDQRLFSCGTSRDAEPYLVEWDESEGYIKRMYKGLKKPCFSTIHFDSNHKGFLAAGDDHMIKFWNMDSVELWASTAFDAELHENPCICFNNKGTLLAATAKEKKIKILTVDDILRKRNEIPPIPNPGILHETLTHTQSSLLIDTCAGVANEDIPMNGRQKGLEGDGRSNSIEGSHKRSRFANVSEICGPSQCQVLQLPYHPKISKIVKLSYTNAGNGILALTSNGDHLLWKWPHNNLNLDGKATAQVSPHIWQSRTGLQLMSNILPADSQNGDPVSCFSLSRNDSYLVSTSGGAISLFNMLTFKTVTTIIPPPPMATCVAFYPRDNNIVAVGMDDSSIIIYYARTNKIISKLEGHSKRVTSLAFSNVFELLISGDMNAQIFVWNSNGWGKHKDRYLLIPGLGVAEVASETYIEFHRDQKQFLVVRNNHLAIYEPADLRCVDQWVSKVPVFISQATFSSDCLAVYACFVDGTVAIFDTLNFQMRCRINPSAYFSTVPSSSIYPFAIAAHPGKPTQFAVGLTDGRVFVFEPHNQYDWSGFNLHNKQPINTTIAGPSNVGG
ncbi:hypothetical protein Fmac_000693 [Flemingia macrophylla]|uniref:CTLH domain-containing protein n=1 Tax=Flemingia macrophylla TaxID=520843 RepID=A0ABD1NEZ4_9FABA